MKHEKSPEARSLPDTLKAVAWSFIGLRRKSDFDKDVGNMNPVYVVVAGLLGVAALVATLLAVARSVAG